MKRQMTKDREGRMRKSKCFRKFSRKKEKEKADAFKVKNELQLKTTGEKCGNKHTT